MQQVADWLEKLGLGQYAQRFAENDISFAILPDLTDQDLERDWRCVARSSTSVAARDSRTKGRDESAQLRPWQRPSPRKTPPSAAKSQ